MYSNKNKHYTQIAKIELPQHEGAYESATTLYVFDLTDEHAEAIYDAACSENENYVFDAAIVREIILSDLGCFETPEWAVAPGAFYHSYAAQFDYPYTVLLWDTLSINV